MSASHLPLIVVPPESKKQIVEAIAEMEALLKPYTVPLIVVPPEVLAELEAIVSGDPSTSKPYQPVIQSPSSLSPIAQAIVSGTTFPIPDPWIPGSDSSSPVVQSFGTYNYPLAVFPGPSRPRQEPLFELPPPATPRQWALEWRWRDGETNWRGEPRDYSWSILSHYTCPIRLKKRLRSARYSDWEKRKMFRVRITGWDYRGDILFTGPPEVTAENIPF